jgi:DNA-binding NarL/FixJ family response regulator
MGISMPMPKSPDTVTAVHIKRARILLADDDLPMLASISKLLQTDFDVIGAVSDGRSLVEAALEWRPDIIVTDISMPKLNGIAAARKIRDALPGIRFIFLTMHWDHGYREEARRVGAVAYILKTSAREELTQAVHEAMRCPT